MDVKQASKKWRCSASTVRRYCNTGVIPPAEKIRNRWVIPDDCEMPPLTRYGLCLLMDTIYQIKDGVDVKKIRWGHSDETVRRGYEYLVGYAFISSFDVNRLESELKHVTITSRGKDLILREEKEGKSKYTFNTRLWAEINLGVVNAGVETEISNTNESSRN